MDLTEKPLLVIGIEWVIEQASKKIKLPLIKTICLQSYNGFAFCECLEKDLADHSILAVTSR